MKIEKVESVLRGLNYMPRRGGMRDEKLFTRGKITISLMPHDKPDTSRFVIYDTEENFEIREASIWVHTSKNGFMIERRAIITWNEAYVTELLETLRRAGLDKDLDNLKVGQLSVFEWDTILHAKWFTPEQLNFLINLRKAGNAFTDGGRFSLEIKNIGAILRNNGLRYRLGRKPYMNHFRLYRM